MDKNPDKDTEHHVQPLFIGSYRETGMGRKPAGVVFNVSTLVTITSFLLEVIIWKKHKCQMSHLVKKSKD